MVNQAAPQLFSVSKPFGTVSVQVEAFPSPNRTGYHVLHVGLKGRSVSEARSTWTFETLAAS